MSLDSAKVPTPGANDAKPGISYGRQVHALLARDLVLEVRTKDALGAMLVLCLLVLVTFNLALDLRPDVVAAVGPGVLWVAVVFGSTVGLGRTFAAEHDHGTIDGLLLAPVDRSAIFVAKLLHNALVMALVQIVSVPTYGVLFGASVFSLNMVIALLLGTVGLAAVGTIFSAIAAHTRAREVMLPVLLLPVSVPVVIGVVQLTGLALGSPTAHDMPWTGLLVAFDAVYVALGILSFEYVLEE